MFTEEECFALQSLNAPHCICCYEDSNEQPRLLVVNETGLLALRTGLGPACNRYGLEPLPAESIPEGAKLVACKVVRTCRGGGGGSSGSGSRSLGMVCMVMLAPPVTASTAEAEVENPRADGGTKQGDSAGGPAVRSAAAAQNSAAAAAAAAAAVAGGGLLNVYALGGERGFEVERALQRQPQQQILLPYAPEGMAHTTVWRTVAALPNFVGGGGGGGGGGGAAAGASSTSSPANSQRRFRVERGDAVLVWDQDGIVHGYTRWEGGGGLAGADSSTSRGGGGVGNGSGGGGASGYAAMLTAESRESLETLIPELRGIDGRVSCLAFDAAEGDESASRRRRLLAGCKDSVRCSSLDDVASGRGETAVTSVAGPVCAVAFTTCPRFVPHDQCVDDTWGGNVTGFACTELDMLAWLVEGGGGSSGGSGGRGGLGPRWCTGTLPLAGAGGDQLTCMGCANFCRDGSTSVAVGTNLGKVIVYGADADPGDHATAEVGVAENSGDDEGLAFGLGDADYEDNPDDDESGSSDVAQTSSRRGDSTSPRPPAAAAAAAAAAGRQQHHNRHVTERAGGGGAYHADHSLGNNNPRRPLLSVRWQRDVPHGVLRIVCGDFNHDGASELIVATHYGVHVFHPDYREEASRFAKTMWTLKMLQPKEEGEEDRQDSVSTASADDDEEKPSRGVNSLGMEIRNVNVDVVGADRSS